HLNTLYCESYPDPTIVYPDIGPTSNVIYSSRSEVFNEVQNFLQSSLSSVQNVINNYVANVAPQFTVQIDQGNETIKNNPKNLFAEATADFTTYINAILLTAITNTSKNISEADIVLISDFQAQMSIASAQIQDILSVVSSSTVESINAIVSYDYNFGRYCKYIFNNFTINIS
ncbi:hypothetical protein EDEG_04242, partial [Edhazardia aedis USNM 41457]